MLQCKQAISCQYPCLCHAAMLTAASEGYPAVGLWQVRVQTNVSSSWLNHPNRLSGKLQYDDRQRHVPATCHVQPLTPCCFGCCKPGYAVVLLPAPSPVHPLPPSAAAASAVPPAVAVTALPPLPPAAASAAAAVPPVLPAAACALYCLSLATKRS